MTVSSTDSRLTDDAIEETLLDTETTTDDARDTLNELDRIRRFEDSLNDTSYDPDDIIDSVSSSDNHPRDSSPIEAELIETESNLATIEDIDEVLEGLEAIAELIEPMDEGVKRLGSRFDTLINILKEQGGLSSSSADVKDLRYVVAIQRKIMQAMMTSPVLPVDVKEKFVLELTSMKEWDQFEAAQARLAERERQRKLVESSSQ